MSKKQEELEPEAEADDNEIREDHVVTPALAMELGLDIDFNHDDY